MVARLYCTVIGEPIPQGSKRHVGNGVMIEANKRLPEWRDLLAYKLLQARYGRPPFEGPVSLTLTFRLSRPHRYSKWWQKMLDYHASRPDLDKLTRAVFDAMTAAGVVEDDAQICTIQVTKLYARDGGPKGVDIVAEQLLDRPSRT